LKLQRLERSRPCPMSPPARGRGLKLISTAGCSQRISVAPRAGAWIETNGTAENSEPLQSRPPRGGVD